MFSFFFTLYVIIKNMKHFVENANGRTLFFIDELGSGSDPHLGGAFAEVILEELVRKSQQSDVLIYSIGILSEEEPREARRARRALHDLAIASGGMDYYPKDLEEVDKITPQVAHEVRNQYTLGYTPTNLNLDGTFRKITVAVNAPGRPTVRSRNGYYATPNNK